VSLRALPLGQCQSGQILTCRGDYMARLVTAEADCAGAVVAVDAQHVSAPQEPAADSLFGTLYGCSSPSAAGLTPSSLPSLATVTYGSAQCSGSPSHIRFSTPEDCNNGSRVLSATPANVTVQLFDDDSCDTLVDAQTVADLDCVAGGSARYTSAQSCNVSTLAFAEWAGWPTSNSGVGGCPQDIGAAQTAAHSHTALVVAAVVALAIGLVR